jgi:hypothetical protein
MLGGMNQLAGCFLTRSTAAISTPQRPDQVLLPIMPLPLLLQ